MVGEKARVLKDFLKSDQKVMKMIKIIMYYAPIGLACYFASIIGQLGAQILQAILRFSSVLGFINYILLCILSIYAHAAAGKEGFA